MRPQRFRVIAARNRYERLPNGDAPSFDVLGPPAHFVERYTDMILDVRQLEYARQEIAACGYRFDDVRWHAWVKE